jgi:hypothetical protein
VANVIILVISSINFAQLLGEGCWQEFIQNTGLVLKKKFFWEKKINQPKSSFVHMAGVEQKP